MQFTKSEKHVRFVERVKAPPARSRPGRSLGVHLEAMKLLVVALEKRKFASPKACPCGADGKGRSSVR
jgi:hypothetical protein